MSTEATETMDNSSSCEEHGYGKDEECTFFLTLKRKQHDGSTEPTESMDYCSNCEEQSDGEEEESGSTEPAESMDDSRNCDEQSDAEEEENIFFLGLKRKRNDGSSTGSKKKEVKKKESFHNALNRMLIKILFKMIISYI